MLYRDFVFKFPEGELAPFSLVACRHHTVGSLHCPRVFVNTLSHQPLRSWGMGTKATERRDGGRMEIVQSVSQACTTFGRIGIRPTGSAHTLVIPVLTTCSRNFYHNRPTLYMMSKYREIPGKPGSRCSDKTLLHPIPLDLPVTPSSHHRNPTLALSQNAVTHALPLPDFLPRYSC